MKLEHRGLTLIVNKQKREVQDATIPIQWMLDQALCKVGLKHLFVSIRHESDLREEGHERLSRGERRLVKITDGELYIQFPRPGKYKVMVMPLSPDVDVADLSKLLLKKSSRRDYEGFIDVDDIHRKVNSATKPEGEVSRIPLSTFLLSQSFEVTVPQELFAKRPQSAFAKWFFGLVNLIWPFPPVDQCELRKRTIIAFLGPLELILVGRIFMVLWSFILSLYVVLARVIVAFFGYYPTPLFKGIGRIWKEQVIRGRFEELGWSFTHDADFRPTKFTGPYACRTWKYDGGRRITLNSLSQYRNTVIRMPISLSGLSLMAGMLWLLVTVWTMVPFIAEAAMISVIGVSVGRIIMRIVKPVHKKGNYLFWDWDYINGVPLFSVISVIGSVLLWALTMHGNQVMTWFVEVIQGLWSWLVLARFYIFGALLVIAVIALAFRFRKSIPQWKPPVWFTKWKEDILARRRESMRKKEIQDQERIQKARAEADRLRQEWQSRQPVRKVQVQPVLVQAKDCPNCEPQTLGDKLRLVFFRTKAAVCKPYAS